METTKVLEDLYEGRIEIDEAHGTLAGEHDLKDFNKKNLKRAHFVKLSIRLPNESRRLNLFMRLLFAFPLPVILISLFVRIAGKKSGNHSGWMQEAGLDEKDLRTIIRYARGTRVRIENEDALITIKII